MTLEQVKKKGHIILIIAFLLGSIFTFLVMKSCESDPIIVKTKEKKGSFVSIKPKHYAIPNITTSGKKPTKIENDSFQDTNDEESEEIIKLQNENKKLIDIYISSTDSLQLIILEQAIQLNAFTQTWDNNDLKATVSGISRGTVESIKLDYTIKPQSVKCPENPFRILGGFELGSNEELNSFSAKANLGFQNRKGNILNIGFDTQQKIYLGYSTTLIKF